MPFPVGLRREPAMVSFFSHIGGRAAGHGLVAAGLVAIGLAACGETGETGPRDGGRELQPLSLKVMYPLSGKGDRGFADSVYTGVVEASVGAEFDKTEVQPVEGIDPRKVLYDWVAAPVPKRPELIITVSFAYTDILNSMVCKFNKRRMLHLDDDGALAPCPGLRGAKFRTFAPSFLAGAAAVEVSRSKRVAVLGALDSPVVTEFMRGFEYGVAHAGGTLTAFEYLGTQESAFTDSEGAQARAAQLYEHADVVFPVAGGAGLGVFEAAKEAPGRYVIGVDADQSYLGRTVVIGSVMKRLDKAVKDAITSLAEGQFADGNVTMGMDSGYTEFRANPFFEDRVAAAVAAARAPALEAEKAYAAEHP